MLLSVHCMLLSPRGNLGRRQVLEESDARLQDETTKRPDLANRGHGVQFVLILSAYPGIYIPRV